MQPASAVDARDVVLLPDAASQATYSTDGASPTIVGIMLPDDVELTDDANEGDTSTAACAERANRRKGGKGKGRGKGKGNKGNKGAQEDASPNGDAPEPDLGRASRTSTSSGGTDGGKSPGRRSSLRRGECPKDIERWAEYEGVLMNCELSMADCVDKWCRKCCPFRRCAVYWDNKRKAEALRRQQQEKAALENLEVSASSQASGTPASTSRPPRRQRIQRHSWWEGMSDKVPERYQRWEGIRERNTILSLLLGLCGYGRKQPTKMERVHLFMLYAVVWYLCYVVTVRRGSASCHRTWVETCVPESLGGGCADSDLSRCASTEVLAQTPDDFSDYAWLASKTSHRVDLDEAECLRDESGSPRASACDMPMCAPKGERPCERRGSDVGFCYCEESLRTKAYSIVVYAIAFKILYYPVWQLFLLDLAGCCHCKTGARLSVLIVFISYVLIGAITVLLLYEYTGSFSGVGDETLLWLASFSALCLFEVFKAFTLGYVGGAYVVYPLCGPCISKLWKFCLS